MQNDDISLHSFDIKIKEDTCKKCDFVQSSGGNFGCWYLLKQNKRKTQGHNKMLIKVKKNSNQSSMYIAYN